MSKHAMLGFVSAFLGLYLWQELRLQARQLALVEAQGDAAAARETMQKLLSKGRFIRTYNADTGASTYRFAAAKEQR